MADGIIDIRSYLDRRDDDEFDDEDGGVFALHGAEGERARFALPLWRAVYLAGGDRGAVVSTPMGEGGAVDPFVVLDLAHDPARTDYSSIVLPAHATGDAPAFHDWKEAGLHVYLGDGVGRSWYLSVDGGSRPELLGSRDREDVLFLSGECAGLLFFRELAAFPR